MGLLDTSILDKYGTVIDSNTNFRMVPTGAIELDALSGGGLSGVIEIYGEESTGKCITGDSLIITGDGIKSIKSAFESLNESNTTDEYLSKGTIKALQPTDNGYEFNKTHVYYDGPRNTYNIRLKNNTRISGSSIHRVMNQNNEWVKLSDVKVGDKLQVAYGACTGKSFPISQYYGLLPLFVLLRYGGKKVTDIVYTKDDKLIINVDGFTKYMAKGETSLAEYLSRITGNTVSLIPLSLRWGTWSVTGISEKDLCIYISDAIAGPNSIDVLTDIMGDSSSIYDFSAMLRNTHGAFIDTKSLNLLRYILIYMGLLSPEQDINKDYLCNIDKLKNNLFSGIALIEVVSIDNSQELLYDLSFPSENHTYIANGLVTHNTTLGLALMRHGCAMGIPGIYFSTEWSLKYDTLETFGLLEYQDAGLFVAAHVVSAIEISKTIKEILQDFKKKGYDGPINVAIDSLGGIVTDIESLDDLYDNIKGQGLENNTIGQQSKVIQKLYNEISKIVLSRGINNGGSGFLLTLNQARDKIDMSWGAKRGGEIVSPGGHAYKHLLHIQLVLEARQLVYEGQYGDPSATYIKGAEVVGRKVKWTLTKTKDGNQGRKGSHILDIRNGGIDIYTGIRLMAKQCDFLKYGGAGFWTLNVPDENGEIHTYKDRTTSTFDTLMKSDHALYVMLRKAILKSCGAEDLLPDVNVEPVYSEILEETVEEEPVTTDKKKRGRPGK